MKTKILILIALFIGQTVKAEQFAPYTKIECHSQDGGSFVFTNHARSHANARILDFEGPDHLIGNWLWLVAYNEGSLTSQHVYSDKSGGMLTFSEQTKMGRGGCGRGSCDYDSNTKTISAKLVTKDGQEYIYSCDKVL